MHKLLLAISLLFLACSSGREGQQKIVLTSKGRQEVVWVEVADEPEEHAKGLMHRTELPEGEGMLFVFKKPRTLSFWMKNTLIPLDVIFFDEEGQFMNVQTMVPCEADPCKRYPSRGFAKYALEVNAGYAKEKGLTEGWELSVSENVLRAHLLEE